jgi:hypothetical protein
MRIQAIAFLFLIVAGSSLAHAQHEGQSYWLNVDYTYTDLSYHEPSMSSRAHLAGIRGDLGVVLLDNFAISAGGQYQDGNFYYDGATFSGTPVKQVMKDYVSETYLLADLIMGPAVVSAGIGRREWYDNTVISYRRREIYNYYPMSVTITHEGIYFKVENIIWKSGYNKSYMHDVNPAEKDVVFSQGSGSMYGAEIGYLVPTASHFSTRIFANYRRWDVQDSDIQNDNVNNLQEPKNNTVTMQVGLGLSF